MMIYRGEATDTSDMMPEQGAEVMAKWGAWMESVGSALVDIGAPFGPGASVIDDGTEAEAHPSSGYSIVSADDLAGAKALTTGHPYLSDGNGEFAIDVFQLEPVPFED